jgi:hypothetical protein
MVQSLPDGGILGGGAEAVKGFRWSERAGFFVGTMNLWAGSFCPKGLDEEDWTMTRGAAAMLVLAMALGARAQDDKKSGGSDKIGKDKPPVVATKFLAEVQKRKGAAISEVNTMGGQQQAMTNFEGVLRKDFAGVKGTAEVYAKGSSYLVNTGARFDPPEELQGQDSAQAGSFKNPFLFFADLQKIAPSATFGDDEVVDGKDCIVVDFVASQELIRQYVKELSDRLSRRRGPGGLGGFGGGAGMFNLSSAVDEKKTIATFRACVGKSDLLLYKLEFVMKPELRPNALPKEVRIPPLDQKTEVKFSKWDEEVAFDIPGFIKTKWGLK